jgi:hypothetical protein
MARWHIARRLKTIRPSYNRFKRAGNIWVSHIIPRWGVLPPDFIPWAPGIVVPSQALLRRLGCKTGRAFPPGWRRLGLRDRDDYSDGSGWGLSVMRCGNFWCIKNGGGVLVFDFASQPICTRNHIDAMYLAEAAKKFYPHRRSKKIAAWPFGPPVRWFSYRPSYATYI